MSKTMLELLTYENSVLRNYLFWSALLIIKVALMALLTGVQRFLTKSYSNPEDVRRFNVEIKVTENVERVRRAHLNDLENIIPLVLVMFMYVLTDPLPAVAVNLFRVIFALRLWHTIVYSVYVIRQPARMIGFGVPYFIMLYMCVMVAIKFVN